MREREREREIYEMNRSDVKLYLPLKSLGKKVKGKKPAKLIMPLQQLM